MTRRSLIRAAALAWLAGWAVFGLPWFGVTRHPRTDRLNLVPFRNHTYRRRDLALNFLYYIPLGLISVDLGRGMLAILIVALALSCVTELLQIFSVDRYPSVTDIVLNVAGAAAGGLAAFSLRRGLHQESGATRPPSPGEK